MEIIEKIFTSHQIIIHLTLLSIHTSVYINIVDFVLTKNNFHTRQLDALFVCFRVQNVQLLMLRFKLTEPFLNSTTVLLEKRSHRLLTTNSFIRIFVEFETIFVSIYFAILP